MNRRITRTTLLTLSLLAVCICARAQDDVDPDAPPLNEKPDTVRFFIESRQHRVPSRYSHLEFLDQRKDTIDIGQISTSTYFDKRVIAGRPMREQVTAMFQRMIDEQAGPGTILVQVQRFGLFDAVGNFGHKDLVTLRVGFYAHNTLASPVIQEDGSRIGEEYRLLYRLDTVLTETHGGFNGSLQKKVFGAITDVLAAGLAQAMDSEPAADAETYTPAEMLDFYRARRNHLPVYKADTLATGVYLSFDAFAHQRPDYTKVWVNFEEDGRVFNVLASPVGVLTPKQVYAIVYKGKTYISSEGEYYPLERPGPGLDLTFTGKLKVRSASASSLANFGTWALSFAFLRVVAIGNLWNIAAKKKFRMVVDPINGACLPVKPVE